MRFLLQCHYILLNRMAESHTNRLADWRLLGYCRRCPRSVVIWDINCDSIFNPIRNFRKLFSINNIEAKSQAKCWPSLCDYLKVIFWPATRNVSHIRIMLQYIDFLVLYNVWWKNVLRLSFQPQCSIYASLTTVDSCAAHSTDLDTKTFWLVLHSKAINAN